MGIINPDVTVGTPTEASGFKNKTMAKRPDVDIRNKTSRSKKTKKRLAIKHAKIAARKKR